MCHQLLVDWKLLPGSDKSRDQLAEVILVLRNVPSQPVLLNCILFDLVGVVYKSHEDLVDLAWFEVYQ